MSTPYEYSNIRNNNKQTLPQKQLDQSVSWQQLCSNSTFPIKHLMHLENVLFLKMSNLRDIPQTEKQFQIEEKFEEPKEILTAAGTFRILASQTMIFKFSFSTKA